MKLEHLEAVQNLTDMLSKLQDLKSSNIIYLNHASSSGKEGTPFRIGGQFSAHSTTPNPADQFYLQFRENEISKIIGEAVSEGLSKAIDITKHQLKLLGIDITAV